MGPGRGLRTVIIQVVGSSAGQPACRPKRAVSAVESGYSVDVLAGRNHDMACSGKWHASAATISPLAHWLAGPKKSVHSPFIIGLFFTMSLFPVTLSDFMQQRQAGAFSAQAWVEDCLARAESSAAAHVFTKLYPQAAHLAARHADEAHAAGLTVGPLAGVPVTIKDLYDVAGETTTAGTTVFAGDAPARQDAPAVARLRAAGAAIVGKTNMTELAFSGIGINPHYGTPVNPADTQVQRIPGGSSSGAAVSVALGLAVAGLGSDTGGSIRIPAALCGVVGFKSTQSRVPLAGAVPLSHSLDTVCAMTRSVADCLVVDGVLSGQPLAVAPRPLKGRRLAVPQTLMLDGLDATVARAFERSLSRLSQAGALLEDIALTELADIATLNAPGGFSPVECWAAHHERIADVMAQLDPRVASRAKLGQNVSAADYLRMLANRQRWIQRVEAALAGYDAILSPTVPIVAPELELLNRDDDAFAAANRSILRNTFAINFLDGCSFSLPCQAAEELPVGLMVSSVRGDDARLGSVALAIEAALA